jgi:5-methylcytosine-specific restriction endonuclease McrA
MPFRCIKLNASWEPIEIISWWKACNITYFCDEPKANILWSYPDDYKIRAQYEEWAYPSIIVLKEYSRRKPRRKITPGLKSILVRDNYTCLYCGDKLSNSTGTRDHVIPESKGGPTTWENMVACCKACQQKKKDHFCKEVNMFPTVTPREPLFSERFMSNIKISSAFERRNWKLGFTKLGLTNLLDGSF